MRTFLSTLVLASLGACHVSAPAGNYTWSVQAPENAVHAPHSKLKFVVETKAADGKPVTGVPFVWVVDWVGLHGTEHNGDSFAEESILVKGGAGMAYLRILALDPNGRLIEVVSKTFNVSYPQP